MKEFADAVSVECGRCFRIVDDREGGPAHCSEQVIASGWRQVGDKCHQVDARCQRFAQLRQSGSAGTTRRSQDGPQMKVTNHDYGDEVLQIYEILR